MTWISSNNSLENSYKLTKEDLVIIFLKCFLETAYCCHFCWPAWFSLYQASGVFLKVLALLQLPTWSQIHVNVFVGKISAEPTSFGMINFVDVIAGTLETADLLWLGIISYVGAIAQKIIHLALLGKFGALQPADASHASNKRNATQSSNIGTQILVNVNAKINLIV